MDFGVDWFGLVWIGKVSRHEEASSLLYGGLPLVYNVVVINRWQNFLGLHSLMFNEEKYVFYGLSVYKCKDEEISTKHVNKHSSK